MFLYHNSTTKCSLKIYFSFIKIFYLSNTDTKAPYHKSWPDLKSSSKTLPIRRKVLNVHALFILTILMIDSTDLLHSIWHVPTLCLNQCLHSMWHTIDQVIQYILSNRPPNFVYPFANCLTNVLRGSTKCCCIWISPMEFKFEVCPEILDQIHIG